MILGRIGVLIELIPVFGLADGSSYSHPVDDPPLPGLDSDVRNKKKQKKKKKRKGGKRNERRERKKQKEKKEKKRKRRKRKKINHILIDGVQFYLQCF